MDRTKMEKTKALELQKTSSHESVLLQKEALGTDQEPSSIVDSQSVADSLRQAQNQLGLCLQKQRQVGFILREVKDILKR